MQCCMIDAAGALGPVLDRAVFKRRRVASMGTQRGWGSVLKPCVLSLRGSVASCCKQADGAGDARWDRLDFVEVLHLEAVAVLCDEWLVVVRGQCGPGVQRRVVDVDLDVVLAGFEELRYIEAVGWVPERARPLAVDVDDGCRVDGRVVPGVHARAGAGDER